MNNGWDSDDSPVARIQGLKRCNRFADPGSYILANPTTKRFSRKKRPGRTSKLEK